LCNAKATSIAMTDTQLPELRPMPKQMDRTALGVFVTSSRFRNFILAVIVVNAVVIGLETSAVAMAAAGPLLTAIDHACLAIFVLEIVLKLLAFRWNFFRDAWNIFDFIVIGISLAPGGQGLSVLRSLRILRVLKAISLIPSLRRVIEGLISALPGMGSVFALMSLIFYIAAVMATKLFGAAFADWFGTIGLSAYSLFQIMTLESWSMGIVRPVMEVYPWAWAFFVPFILITTFAVVNLIVGLVVNSMQDAHSSETDAQTDEYRDAVIGRLQRIEAQLAELSLREPERGGGQPSRGERQRN
jgi:voltage-gated sodium channel